MKTHTKDFKEQIKNLGRQLDSKLTYTIDGVTKTLTNEDLNSVTPVFQGAILKSVMKPSSFKIDAIVSFILEDGIDTSFA